MKAEHTRKVLEQLRTTMLEREGEPARAILETELAKALEAIIADLEAGECECGYDRWTEIEEEEASGK